MSRSEEFYAAQKAHRYFGARNIDALFSGDSPTRPVPWDQAGRRKDRWDYDQNLVDDELRKPASEISLTPVDPRGLHATQPGIVRAGVQHYLSDDYRNTGRTFADHHQAYNQHPVVYRRTDLYGREPQDLLLSGHHRGAAALLNGVQLQARLVEGPWGPLRGAGRRG